MRSLLKIYRETLRFLTHENRGRFLAMTGFFLVTAAAAYGILLLNGEAAKAAFDAFAQAMVESVGAGESGELSAWTILLRNLQACLVAILLGFVPFLYLSGLSVLINGAAVGLTLAGVQLSGMQLWQGLLGLFPHGLLELPALFLAFSLGVYLCLEVTRSLLGKRMVPFRHTLLRIAVSYAGVLLPLLAAAALLEVYVTPALLRAVL